MPNAIKIDKLTRALQKIGFREIRQKGSHKFFQHPDGRTTVIPYHPEIHIRLLTKIIKHDLKMKKNEFMKYV